MSDPDHAFNLVALAVMRCGHLAGRIEADNLKAALAELPEDLPEEWRRVYAAAVKYLAGLEGHLQVLTLAGALKDAVHAAYQMPIVVHQNWQNRADICG